MMALSTILQEIIVDHNDEHLHEITDPTLQKIMRDFLRENYSYLNITIHELLPWIQGNHEILRSLPHLNTRQYLGVQPSTDYPLIRTYIESLPTFNAYEYDEFVRSFKPYLNIHSLQYMYSLVAERLSIDNMAVFVHEMRLFIPPFMDVQRIKAPIDWERFFDHDMPWSPAFLDYMQHYWPLMPLSVSRWLRPEHRQCIPPEYINAIQQYQEQSMLMHSLLPKGDGEEYTLGELLLVYQTNEASFQEIPVIL